MYNVAAVNEYFLQDEEQSYDEQAPYYRNAALIVLGLYVGAELAVPMAHTIIKGFSSFTFYNRAHFEHHFFEKLKTETKRVTGDLLVVNSMELLLVRLQALNENARRAIALQDLTIEQAGNADRALMGLSRKLIQENEAMAAILIITFIILLRQNKGIYVG